MEIRKLQCTGGGTYILSLPKKWIEKYSLQKGDSFGLFEQENGLFITPKFEERKEKQVEITADEFVARKIMTSYTYGYSSLSITGNLTNEVRSQIRKTVDTLLGYEIIDEKENAIFVQDLLNPSELTTEKALKREYFLASSMHKDLNRAISSQRFGMANDIITRDSEVDKLYFLIVRQLRSALQNTGFAEKVGVSPLECLDVRIVAKNVEEIGDSAETASRNLLEIDSMPEDIAEDMVSFSELAFLMHETAFRAFLDADRAKANLVIEKLDEAVSRKEELDERILKAEQAVLLGNIVENIEIICEKGSDVADLVFTPED
ncbi:MAG: phosphate uptake regulator PhoU [Theionarchaea archaeon]|nr:phosphate uptake regulator PhoU [Theionarchaea archaeon]MBU7038433.1 phosphate uptake regulator PhoU [Theionarchaea archaeon]